MKIKLNIHPIFILLAGGLWGTSGIFVRKIESTPISEMQLVLARSLFSFIIMGLIILFKDKKLFIVKLKDIWAFACAGIFSIVFFNFCYYKTMSLTTLSVAAVLLYTAPFFVVIMSIFIFGQKLTVKKFISCATAFIGCCFVSGIFSSAQRISGKAIFFGIMTGLGYSLYTIFSRILLDRKYNSLTITFYTFVFSSIGCLVFVNPVNTVKATTVSPWVFITVLLMAVINTVLPYILYTFGLKGVDSSTAPIIATVEPVVATLIGTIIYHEQLTAWGIIGIMLVIGSVIILNLKAGGTGAKDNGKGKCQN